MARVKKLQKRIMAHIRKLHAHAVSPRSKRSEPPLEDEYDAMVRNWDIDVAPGAEEAPLRAPSAHKLRYLDSSTESGDGRHVWSGALARQHQEHLRASPSTRAGFSAMAAAVIARWEALDVKRRWWTLVDLSLADSISEALHEKHGSNYDEASREREPYIHALLDSHWTRAQLANDWRGQEAALSTLKQLDSTEQPSMQAILLQARQTMLEQLLAGALKSFIRKPLPRLDSLAAPRPLMALELLRSLDSLEAGIIRIAGACYEHDVLHYERVADACKALIPASRHGLEQVVHVIVDRTLDRLQAWATTLGLKMSLFTTTTTPAALGEPLLVELNFGPSRLRQSLMSAVAQIVAQATLKALEADLTATPTRYHRCLETWQRGAEASAPLFLDPSSRFSANLVAHARGVPANANNLENCYRPTSTTKDYEEGLGLQSSTNHPSPIWKRLAPNAIPAFRKHLADIFVLGHHTEDESEDSPSSKDVQKTRWQLALGRDQEVPGLSDELRSVLHDLLAAAETLDLSNVGTIDREALHTVAAKALLDILPAEDLESDAEPIDAEPPRPTPSRRSRLAEMLSGYDSD